jgi:hypothetical protein
MEGVPTDAQRVAVEDAARHGGGSARWRCSAAAGRSYASIAVPNRDAASIPVARGATLYDGALIALAVFPALPEALPPVADALGGPGRPAGILACHSLPGGVIVEWDPSISRPALVMGVIDAELRRFACGRTSELLSPLPAEVATQIAAEGLGAEQVLPARVLELQIGSDHV